MIKRTVVSGFLLLSCLSSAQNLPQLTENFYRLQTVSSALRNDEPVPATFCSAMMEGKKDSVQVIKGKWLNRKLTNESLIQKQIGDTLLCFEPLFQFEGGRDFSDTLNTLYINSRGVRVYGTFGKRLRFETGFLENQSYLPSHIRSYVKDWSVVPGYGRSKPFKTNGADFAMAWGSITYKLNSSLSVQAGHLRNFIGYGHRSLFLSDMSGFFPSLSIIVHRPKLSIKCTYTALHDIYKGQSVLNPLSEPIFKKKVFSWQYFEYRFHKRLTGSLYHAIVSTGPARWNLIPFPGIALAETAQPIAMQAMYGLQLLFIPFKGIMVYSQYAFCNTPDFGKSKNNRSAFQTGLLYAFGGKLKGLSLSTEFNSVMPLTYSDVSKKGGTGFYAANLPIAYARGSGIRELIIRLSYTYKKIFLEGSAHLTQTFKPYSGLANEGYDGLFPIQRYTSYNTSPQVVMILENATHARGILDGRAGWKINSKTGLQIYGGLTIRSAPSGQNSISMVYAGIATRLFNRFTDL